MTGQCKLCLRSAASLQNSHFLSAAIYRILRDEKAPNPNPFQISNKGFFQTSRQMKAHLLCSDCEKRLSTEGENWVLRNCLKKDGMFPLASLLASRTPDLSDQTETRVYYASGIPGANVPALAYFAASIFWRGAIYPWNSDGSCPVSLGPFQEEYRQYLNGGHPFPKNSVLWVTIREGERMNRLTSSPFGERQGKFHVYKFPMPGLAFTLYVGKNIPSTLRQMCVVRGHGNPLIATPYLEPVLEKMALGKMAAVTLQTSHK